MANPAIVVDFVANTRDLQKGFKDASTQTSGFGDKLKGIAKGGALAAGAAGIGGLVATLKTGVDEFAQAQKVGAQTNAVLKSTGAVANVSAKHIEDLAGSLMKKSGVDDEAIQSGQNLLLTFTNIRNEAGKGNDVFDQTTKAALDMSTALGTDMKSASMQLGKALNDPIKGITKLTRSGVTFTDAQKKQIEALQKSGDTLGAQKIILAEVNKEFGGSAEAAGKTLPGQLNVLKETFSNLAGELVARLVPVLQATIGWLRDHWPQISAAFKAFWATVRPILENLWGLLKSVFGAIVDNWPLLEPIVASVARTIQAAGRIIAATLKLITDLIRGDWKAAWEDVKKIVSSALGVVRDLLLAAPGGLIGAALKIGKAIFGGIKDGLGAIGGWITDRIGDVREAILGLATGVYNAAKGLGGKILAGIRDGITGVYTEVRERISAAVGAVADFFEGAYAKAKGLGGKIKDGIIDGLAGVINAVERAIKGAVNAIIDVWNRFKIPAIKIKGHTVVPGFGLPDIPRLAKGGIVNSPTMALIGEAGPEAVVPLSGASTSPVEVRVYIGDQELKGLVRTEIIDADTGLARTLLAGAR
jgi:hypothetical protein